MSRNEQQAQIKTAILKVISGSDQWLFYDPRIGHAQRSDFADQVLCLLDRDRASVAAVEGSRQRQVSDLLDALETDIRLLAEPQPNTTATRLMVGKNYAMGHLAVLRSLLAAVSSSAPAELPSACTCLAAGNQVAWEYVHHTNDCPVYKAGEVAKQWLLDHPQLKNSRIFAGAAAWDRETVATLLLQYAAQLAVPAEPLQPTGEQEKEFRRLRQEFELSALGDRPQSMSAAKLRRLIQLERLDATIRATDPVLTPEESDLVIGAIPLQAFPPASPPITPSDAAMRAAEDLKSCIDPFFMLNRDWKSEVAAIITRNLAATPVRNWLQQKVCIAHANAMRQACVRELYAMKAEHKAAGVYPQGNGVFDAIAKRLESLTLDDAAPTASPETPPDETVSDDYALGFENGSAFAVAALLENKGHLNYVFDGMDCCKICGLVKPAAGWTRYCKGPHGISLRAAVPETADDDDVPVCLLCRHFDNTNAEGICQTEVSICSDDYHGTRLCGCKCEFAEPVTTPHAFKGESKSVPCTDCGLIYSAPAHHQPVTTTAARARAK